MARWSRCRWLTAGGLAMAIIISLGVVIFARWAQQPVSQSLQMPATPTAAQPSASSQPLQTAFFETQVPSRWRVQDNTLRATPERLAFVAFAPQGSAGQIAIVSDRLPPGGLAAVADYHLRVSDPAYQSVTPAGLPADAQAFIHPTDVAQYSVFLVRGQRYAIVTASGTSADQLWPLLQPVLAQWSWRI